MNDKNKNNRVRYLLAMLKNENKIENISSDSNPTWILKKINSQKFSQRFAEVFAEICRD